MLCLQVCLCTRCTEEARRGCWSPGPPHGFQELNPDPLEEQRCSQSLSHNSPVLILLSKQITRQLVTFFFSEKISCSSSWLCYTAKEELRLLILMSLLPLCTFITMYSLLRSRDWTQGFMNDRQELYQLSWHPVLSILFKISTNKRTWNFLLVCWDWTLFCHLSL